MVASCYQKVVRDSYLRWVHEETTRMCQRERGYISSSISHHPARRAQRAQHVLNGYHIISTPHLIH